MKVAMCQTNIIWEDKEKNIEKCVEFIEQAKKHNIELMLFPEMSFTGFSMNINNTKENYNYTVQKISKIARENKIAIGFGWVQWGLLFLAVPIRAGQSCYGGAGTYQWRRRAGTNERNAACSTR